MTKLRVIIGGVAIALALGVAAIYVLPRPAQAEGKNDAPLITVGCDSQEVSFGDFAADAVQAAGGTQIALVGAISFRPGTLNPGAITKERVAELLANPDELWAVSHLTGAQIKEALEYAVRTAPLPNNSFLQVAGLTFSYNPNGPQYQRVQAVTVNGAPIGDTKSYTVAMPLSLAKGGSGYFKIFTKDTLSKTGETSLADALVSFGSARGSVSYPDHSRIKTQ